MRLFCKIYLVVCFAGCSNILSKESVYQYQADDWDWGDTSRQYVDNFLRDQSDGTFLVFCEGDPCHLTLAYRLNGRNRYEDIYHRDYLYGFTEPLGFENLEDALEAYNWSPTETGNTLKYPAIKPNESLQRTASSSSLYASLRGLEPRDLLLKLRETVALKSEKAQELERIQNRNEEIENRLLQQSTAVQALERLTKLLAVQQEKHCRILGSLPLSSPESNTALTDNLSRLEKRLSELSTEKQQIAEEKARVEEEKLEGCRNYNICLEDLQTVERTIAHIKRLLLRQNEDLKDFLDCLADNNLDDVHVCPRDIDKTTTEKMLKSSQDGTFVVRNGNSQNMPLVVSVSFEGNVLHFPVLQSDGYFGFDGDTAIFSSIDDLVCQYSKVSFSVHDPIRYQELTLREQCQ